MNQNQFFLVGSAVTPAAEGHFPWLARPMNLANQIGRTAEWNFVKPLATSFVKEKASRFGF